MVIRGLERCGKGELAKEIALEDLQRIGEVFRNTNDIWENYAPDAVRQGSQSAGDQVG